MPYVPDFELEINGQPIPAALRGSITGVTYQDGLNAADRVEVSIANQDLRFVQEHIRGMGFQPFPTGVKVGALGQAATAAAGTFDVDNKLTLRLGYRDGDMVEMFKGEVTGVQASFPAGGAPTMTLVAHDYLNRMTRGTYARGFGPVADMIVAAIVSAENLLLPALDPALVSIATAKTALNIIFNGSGFKQEGESDLQLMQRIAEEYDADFWVEGDTFYMARFFPKEYSPRLTLAYGESLMSFAPQLSTVGQVAAVTKRLVLRELPLTFLITVGWNFDNESVFINVVPGEAGSFAKVAGEPALTIVDEPIRNPGDVIGSSLKIYRTLRRKLNSRLTGSASSIGDPRLRAGAVVALEGMGPDFSSSNYRISSATHTLDSGGYRTDFQVNREILP